MTHICVSKITIIGSDNGLSPGRRQAIIRTKAGILLIGPLGTNFSEILIGFKYFHSGKCTWKYRLRNGVHFVSASMSWGSINNIPALVQIMAWRRPGDKPLFEPMVVNLPTHICVTQPQWVNIEPHCFNMSMLTPKSSGNMQKHGYLWCFHAVSTRENISGVLSSWYMINVYGVKQKITNKPLKSKSTVYFLVNTSN